MNTHPHRAAFPCSPASVPHHPQSTGDHASCTPTSDDLLNTIRTINSTLAHLKCQIARGGARTVGVLSVLTRLSEMADCQGDMLRSAFWMAQQGNACAGIHQLLAHGALQTSELAAAFAALQRLLAHAAQQEAPGSYLARHLAQTWPAALAHVTCSISAVNVEAAQLLAASCETLDAETAAAQPGMDAHLKALREAMLAAVAELEVAAGRRLVR